ncbi:MAG: nucleotide sugar dehydrogenase [Bryobacterales bacterium]|nr:nucleotide sugar dehydrogenase [Bryobacterales bacterium]
MTPESPFQPRRVTILGLGYVGSVTAACFANIGHTVTGVDRDQYKVNCIQAGKAPFFEPGLEEVLRDAVDAGRLRGNTDVAAALADADVAMICVGTPSESNGNIGIEQLQRACGEIRALLDTRTTPLVVAIRSTAFPGVCEQLYRESLGSHPMARIVSNPEFLREGTAMRDFAEPSLIVVGGDDAEAVAMVAGLYHGMKGELCCVSIRTAEMIKYGCNAFHAVKISFANEMGAMCQSLGIPAAEVMETFCKDTRLNISPAYLRPGFAFGGSCLPKDLRALVFRASRLDLNLPLLSNVIASNESHLQRAKNAVMALPGEKLGIFGLAFKENTDDLRESPVVSLLEFLIGKGRTIQVHDPFIDLSLIYGANQKFLLNAIPHIGRLMQPDLDSLLAWADQIVIAQKPSAEYAARIAATGKPVLNLVSL